MRKQYVVFGAGRFGGSVAVTLQELGCDVIVVDKNPEVIQEIADRVSYAICANVEDPEAFGELGLRNVDGAVISMASSLEASIVCTMMCHEMEIPKILAKAKNKLHEKILRSVGAHRVIYPEVEMGRRVAKYFEARNFVDWIELSPEYSLAELKMPGAWCGKTLAELRIREKYGLNMIGLKEGDTVTVNLNPFEKLRQDQTIIVIGSNEDLKTFGK